MCCAFLTGTASLQASAQANVGVRPLLGRVYNGSQVLGHIGKFACLWDAKTGRLLRKMDGGKDEVISAEFNHDGDRALSFSFGPSQDPVVWNTSARLWDVSDGRELTRVDHQLYCKLSPQGDRIATLHWDQAAYDSPAHSGTRVSMWDVATNRSLFDSPIDLPIDARIEFSSDGRLLVAYRDNAEILDSRTGEHVSRLDLKRADPPWDVTFNLSGTKVVVAGQRAEIWGTAGTFERRLLARADLPNRMPTFARFTHDGQHVIVSAYNGVSVSDAKTGQNLREISLPGFAGPLTISSDDNWCLVMWSDSPQDRATLLNLNTGKEVATLPFGSILGFSNDSKKFLVRVRELPDSVPSPSDGEFIVYESSTGHILRKLHLAKN